MPRVQCPHSGSLDQSYQIRQTQLAPGTLWHLPPSRDSCTKAKPTSCQQLGGEEDYHMTYADPSLTTLPKAWTTTP